MRTSPAEERAFNLSLLIHILTGRPMSEDTPAWARAKRYIAAGRSLAMADRYDAYRKMDRPTRAYERLAKLVLADDSTGGDHDKQ